MKFRVTLFHALLVITFLVFSVVPASAISQEDLDAIDQNYIFYDDDISSIVYAGCDGSGSTVSLIGNSNVEQAYIYFLQKGLSSAESAGIVGNLYKESGVDPRRVQGAGYITFDTADEITPGRGYGIAQWTAAARQEAWKSYTLSRGANIVDLGLQLDFLWRELTTNSNFGLAELQQADDDVRQAAWIFLVFFERPAATSGYEANPVQATSGSAKEELDERESYARGVLEAYGGVDAGSLPPGTTCELDTSEPDFSATGVRVDSAGPWIGPSGCSGTFTDGARILREFLLETWQPPVTSIGGYSCRAQVGGSTVMSVHAVGRALDIMISALDPETRIVGDQIRNWLINNSVALGLQRVIWNRGVWSSNIDGWRDYCANNACWPEGGRSPHTDHLHIEINEDGANLLTSWYQGRS